MIYIPNNAYQAHVGRHISTYPVFRFSNLYTRPHTFSNKEQQLYPSVFISLKVRQATAGGGGGGIEIKTGSVFRTSLKSVSAIFPILLTVLIKLMKFYCLRSTMSHIYTINIREIEF